MPFEKEEATQKIPNPNPNLNNPGKTRRSPYPPSFNKTMNHKHGILTKKTKTIQT
jgi:hypothetical protein